MNEFTGKLLEKFETIQVSDKFKKKEIVLTKSEIVGQNEFIDFVKFQLTQDKCSLVDNFEIGDELKISFNIRGNKWEKEGKVHYFTNLEAWRIENLGQNVNQDSAPMPEIEDDPETGDLPF